MIVGVVVGCVGPRRLPAQGHAATNSSTARSCSPQKCGACHVLERAGATGMTGPNLDAAFRQSRKDGLGESTFEGVVEGQIPHPNRNPQVDPEIWQDDPADAGEHRHGPGRARRRRLRRPRRAASRARTRAASPPSAPPRPKAPPRPRTASLDIPVAARGLAYKFADAKAARRQRHRSSPRTRSARRTTSRSRATASTTRARSSPPAAPPSSPPTSSRASTRSSAPSRATARAAWKASSPSSRPLARRAMVREFRGAPYRARPPRNSRPRRL